MKLAIAWLALVPACHWATAQSDSMRGFGAHAMLGGDGRLEGAGVEALIGDAGNYVEGELNLRDADRREDARVYKSFVLGVNVRLSLFGILASEHQLERYFDLGLAGGIGFDVVPGVPPHGADAMFSAWGGAWTELGTVPVHGGYLALTGDLRVETYNDPWNNRIQIALGLAWRQRRPISSEALMSLRD